MAEYSDLVRVLQEQDLDLKDLDRILVSAETYEDWLDHMETAKTSNHRTENAPAIRKSWDEEYVVYVNEFGQEERYSL